MAVRTAQAMFFGAQRLVFRLFTPPKLTQPIASTVKITDHTKMPSSIAEATGPNQWQTIPDTYIVSHPPSKVWAPVLPANWNMNYYPNQIAEPNTTNYRGRLSTLVFAFGLFYFWYGLKTEKEILTLNHLPPEKLRMV